jgi:hypothetical protein
MSYLASTYKLLVLALLVSLVSCTKPAQPPKASVEKKAVPKTFASPSEAGAALLAAAQSGDRAAMLEIFGPEGEEVLFTGDAAQDKANLQDFVTAYKKMNRWGRTTMPSRFLWDRMLRANGRSIPRPAGTKYWRAGLAKTS